MTGVIVKPPSALGTTGDTVVADAASWVTGQVPYLWGGITRLGADCSGFVKAVFGEVGTTIAGRTTSQQVLSGTVIPLGPTTDPLANALPGDVIFYGLNNPSMSDQHEAIYVGGGRIVQENQSGTPANYASAAGSSSEPLSAIRRYVNPGGAAAAAGAGVASGVIPTTPATNVASTTSLSASAGRLAATGVLLAGGALIVVLGAHRAVRRPAA